MSRKNKQICLQLKFLYIQIMYLFCKKAVTMGSPPDGIFIEFHQSARVPSGSWTQRYAHFQHAHQTTQDNCHYLNEPRNEKQMNMALMLLLN